METLLLGETAARCIDSIDEPRFGEDAEIVAVGIIVVVRGADGRTHTRTFCSDLDHYRQVGLFTVALEAVADLAADEEDGDDEP